MAYDRPGHPRWMTLCLIAAGVYNLAWGGLTVLWPGWLFTATGMEPPRYPFIWQCVGMIVGVYGIGYLAAAGDPARHWPIVLVGFLGKIFGPLGYLMGSRSRDGATGLRRHAAHQRLHLVGAVRGSFSGTLSSEHRSAAGDAPPSLEAAVTRRPRAGRSLAAVSRESPDLLRLAAALGCIFCREAIADLAAAMPRIEAAGMRLVNACIRVSTTISGRCWLAMASSGSSGFPIRANGSTAPRPAAGFVRAAVRPVRVGGRPSRRRRGLRIGLLVGDGLKHGRS